jgi:peptidoglycan/xylan/chitin deacetylase (PgdA/CDA1 family)
MRAARAGERVSILTYHSISEGRGPIAISPEVYRRQMAILAKGGRSAVSLGDYRRWRAGELALPARFVVLTFDDGYADFATVAFPELAARGWGCTLFLPTGKLREDAGRDGTAGPPTERFLTWEAVAELARAGVELGGHGITHADLTTLSFEDARREIVDSQRAIEERTGAPARVFAAPFGRQNRTLREVIAQHYSCAVGTALGRAGPSSPLFELPRIEMWYFRDPRRWRRYVDRGPTAYFAVRRLLRGVRRLARGGRP